MIELTSTAKIYPLWVPGGPHIFGWWSLAAIGLILILRCSWRWMKKLPKAPPHETPLPPIITKERRLHQLLEINTSIRTPEQKAKALFAHLFLYLGILEKHDQQQTGYTLAQIAQLPGSEPLFPFFENLYTIIYTDEKITHSTINQLTKSIHSVISGT